MATWKPTHRLFIRPQGDDAGVVVEVMAMPQLANGAGAMLAYTEEEWNAQLEASWTRGADGRWSWRGTRTPLGLLATIEVEELGDGDGTAAPRPCRTVLIVDDEERVAVALERSLRPYAQRWRTQIAHSGEDALAQLAQGTIAAVITDRRMPGMDGLALLQEIARRHPRVARLLLTGSGQVRAPAIAHRVLRKPAIPPVVVAALDAVMAELPKADPPAPPA